MKKFWILCAVFSLAGCGPGAGYIKADRLTKSAVEPWLAQYERDHPTERQGVEDVLTSWEMRLSSAEKTSQ